MEGSVEHLSLLGDLPTGLFKEAPLLAAITEIDLFGAANAVAGRAFKYDEPYALATLILLAASLVAAKGVRRLERRYAKPNR